MHLNLLGPLYDSASKKRDDEITLKIKGFLRGEKTILDVGCGTGRLSKKIQDYFGVSVQGVDVVLPETELIPVRIFDGKELPFADNSFDSVFLIDVLHHTKNSSALFSEAFRVAKYSVLIKDHYYENRFGKMLLKLVDVLGNFRDKVKTPFYFKSRSEWEEFLAEHEHYSIEWRSPFVSKIRIPQVMFYVVKNRKLGKNMKLGKDGELGMSRKLGKNRKLGK